MWFPGDGLQSGATGRLGSGACTPSLSYLEAKTVVYTPGPFSHWPCGFSNRTITYDFNDSRSGGGAGTQASCVYSREKRK